MRRSAGYALRTLVGPWLVLPAIGIEIANFFQRGMPWTGEGLWTVQWFPIALFILGPLCTGAGALDASRLTRPGNIHLVRTSASPSLIYLRAVAWCAGPVMVVHLVAIIGGLVLGGVTKPSVGWPWLAAGIAVQLVAIAWHVAIGSVIGRFTPPILAGVLGAVAGFALFYVLGNAGAGNRFTLLDLGAATVPRLGLTYNGGYLAAQGLVLLVTATLFLSVGVRARSGINIPTPSGAALATAAVAIIITAPAVLPAHRLLEKPEPPGTCWEFFQRREACMYAEHDRFRQEVEGKLSRLMHAADAAGYRVLIPQRIEEISRTYRPTDGTTAPLELDQAYEAGAVSTSEIIISMMNPAHCPRLYDPNIGPPDAFIMNQRRLFATWLAIVGAAGLRRDAHMDAAAIDLEGVPKLSPAGAKKVMGQFARCDLGEDR